MSVVFQMKDILTISYCLPTQIWTDMLTMYSLNNKLFTALTRLHLFALFSQSLPKQILLKRHWELMRKILFYSSGFLFCLLNVKIALLKIPYFYLHQFYYCFKYIRAIRILVLKRAFSFWRQLLDFYDKVAYRSFERNFIAKTSLLTQRNINYIFWYIPRRFEQMELVYCNVRRRQEFSSTFVVQVYQSLVAIEKSLFCRLAWCEFCHVTYLFHPRSTTDGQSVYQCSSGFGFHSQPNLLKTIHNFALR